MDRFTLVELLNPLYREVQKAIIESVTEDMAQLSLFIYRTQPNECHPDCILSYVQDIKKSQLRQKEAQTRFKENLTQIEKKEIPELKPFLSKISSMTEKELWDHHLSDAFLEFFDELTMDYQDWV